MITYPWMYMYIHNIINRFYIYAYTYSTCYMYLDIYRLQGTAHAYILGLLMSHDHLPQ